MIKILCLKLFSSMISICFNSWLFGFNFLDDLPISLTFQLKMWFQFLFFLAHKFPVLIKWIFNKIKNVPCFVVFWLNSTKCSIRWMILNQFQKQLNLKKLSLLFSKTSCDSFLWFHWIVFCCWNNIIETLSIF